MNHHSIQYNKYLTIIILLLAVNCSQIPRTLPPEKPDYLLNSSAYEKSRENSRDLKKMKATMLIQAEQIDSLFIVMETVIKEIKRQKSKSSALKSIVENDLHRLRNEIVSDRDSMDIELTNTLVRIQNKLRILEDRASYTDSTNFEILNMLVMFENKISSLTDSYREISELKTKGKIENVETMSDAEYREKYIEGLSTYQNGEYEKSLKIFNYLIDINPAHDLADNCQYWIGEVYYGMKDYKRSIKEFEKVFTFTGSNKDDDSQYKLGLCYVNIGNKSRAKDEFQKLLEIYPNSEYFQKSKQYLQQL